MTNLRKSERRVCLVPVDGKGGSVFDDTQTVDFSRGGLGFVSRHRIPVNKEIPIGIELNDNDEPVFVVGKVLWVRRILKSKQYRIGISFTDIRRGSKSRLNQYFTEKR